jgi:GDP-L-fucose synthase
MNVHTYYKTVLVTGGSGLVGKAIQKISKNYYLQFHFLSSQDANLTSYDETLNSFSKYKPDYVIHLAAQVGGLYKNMRNQVSMLEDNLQINLNVLRVCNLLNVSKVVCCLSTCIFPDRVSYPIQENKLHDGQPHTSNFGYSYAKRILEIQCRTYQETLGRNYICVIPCNIYGEDDNFSLENGHVIPSLIHKCYLSQKNNTDLVIRGSGNAIRQFIHAQDLARLLIWTLHGYHDLEPIILASTEEYSIKEVVYMITTSLKFEGNIKWDSSYPEGQLKKTVDTSKLKKLLPHFKYTNLPDGINKTVEWFNENYPRCRL